MQINKIYFEYFASRSRSWVLCGGRRSGKTFAICQRLIACCIKHTTVVNVATMTAEQGRLGAYADMRTILTGLAEETGSADWFTCLESPREIRFENGSRIFFNSYQNSQTAKGVACDYLYINEANAFSEQHYLDLMANVRLGVFLDFNPNFHFWIDKYYSDADILHTTWRNNTLLTDVQLDYFRRLKELGTAPGASAVNVRNYKVYYLGEYSEMEGDIFTADALTFLPSAPAVRGVCVFCDPSALRGGDFFAAVLAGWSDELGKVVVLDAFSVNDGSRAEVVHRITEWCRSWDVGSVFIETNGFVGIDFYEFAANSTLPVEGWCSRGNKYDRILSQFGNLTERTAIVDSPQVRDYMQQVYEFGTKCDHDDNADALASAYLAVTCRL